MGSKSENGLDSSAAGALQQERVYNRQNASVKEGVSERTNLRHEDVDLLHQSCRTWSGRGTPI